MKQKWNCPVCNNKAYQRYGGVSVPASKIEEVGQDKTEITRVHVKIGKHFICRGCSVHFSNPTLFNANTIKEKKE